MSEQPTNGRIKICPEMSIAPNLVECSERCAKYVEGKGCCILVAADALNYFIELYHKHIIN